MWTTFRLLGSSGGTGGHVQELGDVLESQIWGMRPDKSAGSIGQAQRHSYEWIGGVLPQGRSGAYLGSRESPGVFGGSGQAEYPGRVRPRFDAPTSAFVARLTGPVQFFKNLLATWKLNSTDATILLGMDPDNQSFVRDLLAGLATLSGRDVKDRIVYLYQIRKTLSALFRNEDVENQWLREPHSTLGERSPMELMLDGSMENLLLVKEYVEAAAGR